MTKIDVSPIRVQKGYGQILYMRLMIKLTNYYCCGVAGQSCLRTISVPELTVATIICIIIGWARTSQQSIVTLRW